ncbi:hypothetical protein [Amycolatopsis sp. CA-230715]|uniref:hypothetical protein n=1 Tax=Amycolatopsis sp. CA-230715 TaxID=2745196 RepID=UPI001C0389A1|nr:hypothetical protein [Amycolatopsis sp. CA-230715]QWF79189.1 hypothetical protein HUW46_02596 [Amycolatopsis sp. CA-230715]
MRLVSSRARLAAMVAIGGLAIGLGAQAASARQDENWRWERPLDSAVDLTYSGVAATGASDVWAVGAKSKATGWQEPALSHYDGKGWTDVAPAPVVAKSARFDLATANAPDDVWAAGTTAVPHSPGEPIGEGEPEIVQHWDGESWTNVARPVPAPGWQSFSFSLATIGRDSVWLVSDDYQYSTMVHRYRMERWDGENWQSVVLPPAPNGKAPEPLRVVASGGKGAAVTAQTTGDDGTIVPLLYRWDGRVWTVQVIPAPAGWSANRLAVDPAGAVYVLRRPSEESSLLNSVVRWDGRTWTELPTTPFSEVNTITVDADGRLWAAGRRPAEGAHGQFAVYDGKEWRLEDLPEDGTSRTNSAAVFELKLVPGTRKLVAAGAFGTGARGSNWGMLLSKG